MEAEPVSTEKLLEEVTIWDLVSTYAEVVRQIEMSRPRQIVRDDVPVRQYMDEVMNRVKERGRPVQFLDLLREDASRPRVVGVFLALLELVKKQEIKVSQAEDERGEIRITLAEDGAPRQ
jgi:segregation and condensation protein A